ncbi:E3 ubiquitin-protein ligase RBBP6-like [Neopsephotus bourkii]|uniref:E3 ubiquitin-protein ligase RBBP6-like n=1 Tax=Neopsephotus bourkii TaxID=309878 RepID=UPI002AA5ADB2|nr:E3 ubiquitin-protein ligase RBBP6-like [Neopsephotus bourkii]
MLTNTGKYAIPVINAEAYARGKRERPPFLPEEPSSSSSDGPIPDELLCLICKDIMTDAAILPCCRSSYCDECIRTALLESEEFTCPACHQTDVSPDALVANQSLRQAVNNFRNGAGYTKRLRKQIQQQQQPPPPPAAPLTTVIPPAALVTAAELPPSSSLSIRSLLEEKGSQVPVRRQLALPSLLGSQGQSVPTAGHPRADSTIHSPGARTSCELSSHTYSKPRSGPSCTGCYSGSRSCSHSHSNLPSPQYPRRSRRKSRDYSRRRSHGRHCSRSRSPQQRRHH